ncbi:hypothetical protein KXD40_003532 [Peronospora effusa]|uniref:alpha-1,2-Mannosidase n=1 Tax=Peronospora effusa TaxID=542832 RepID=A0A3M6VBB1_9STRA|nr:hypothetical protein DD238_006978 [Peronospora effusa]RQM13108.1 hypothetical protein DD237_007244 [Peronospora effusa]UIZ22976.1 hypothetical protein KXD40_003532 [Peronospora effusa]
MSTIGHQRSQQLKFWKNTKFVGGIFIVLLFLYVRLTFQYNKVDNVPADAGDLHDATKQDWQHSDKEANEQGHFRGKKHLPVQTPIQTDAFNHTTGENVGDGADQDAVEEMLTDEGALDEEDSDKTVPLVSLEQQEARRLAVRNAMIFAWGNYEEYAFGADEIGPKDGRNFSNVWGNIACSLVDGLDTLWIMDLKDEFQRARDYVANKLDFSHLGRDGNSVSVFETIIREVGGLLSAFELSGDAVFMQKAEEIMDLLTPAYDKNEGVFYTIFNPYTKKKSFTSWADTGKRWLPCLHYNFYMATIADVGTLQLETRYLSDITGDLKYAEMGDAFYKIVQREGSYNKTGLFPVHFDTVRGEFDTNSSLITVGSFGDSFYEYLLKVYIYSGKRQEDKYLREFYDDAVRGIEEYLLYFSIPDNLYFLHEMTVPSLSRDLSMSHLACFVPGMLALGTLSETQDHAKNAKHLELAEKLMETCYQLYHRQATGLSPESVSFPMMQAVDSRYILRPETVESLFYLYRITKNSKYREYGWKIFEALETHAKTKYGYAVVANVTTLPAQTENKMESFFLAETLKYHYLLQAPESLIPLDEYVFNTEAHPLRIRRKN